MNRVAQIGSAVGLEELNVPLLSMGGLLVAIGALVPGTQPAAVTALIVVGSSFMALSVLVPVSREFEIGLTKFRFSRGDLKAPTPWMVAQAETLSNIARWVVGDPELARNVVEDTLSKVRRVNRRIPRDDRELMKLKTLVASLDSANQRREFANRGQDAKAVPTGMIDALQRLDFSTRVAFALRAEFPIKEVAAILERSEGDIASEVDRARKAVTSLPTET